MSLRDSREVSVHQDIRITVFVPTYNRAKYLRECLKALEQQGSGLEETVVIVSDNASEDETPEVIREFASLNLRYYRNPENLGIIGNFNRVLELCDTEFVVLLPDDVMLAPGFIQRALTSLSEHEHATMYSTAALVTYPPTYALLAEIVTPLIVMPSMLWPLQLRTWDYEIWAAACVFRPPIYTGAAAFRYSFISKAMPWVEGHIANADRWTYFEAGRRGQILFDPWIAAYTVVDDHNLGNGLPEDIVRTEYREVTQQIIEETRKDGIDVLGWWQEHLRTYARQDQMRILWFAKFSLPETVYNEVFGEYDTALFNTYEPKPGRLEHWGVPERIADVLRVVRHPIRGRDWK